MTPAHRKLSEGSVRHGDDRRFCGPEEPRPLALLAHVGGAGPGLFATLPPLGMVHDWLAHQRVHAAGGAELEEALKAAHELVDDLISESFEALRLEKPEVERSANRMVELLNHVLSSRYPQFDQ